MGDVIKEILALLQRRGEHWKSMGHGKRMCVLSSLILLFLIALTVAGHRAEIGVSINGKNSELFAVPNSLLIGAVVVDSVLLLLSILFFMGPDTTAESSTRQTPSKKLQIHVVLPYGKAGGTLGDGLLQVAGFLAASDEFANQLEIMPHDHKNKSDEAARIFLEVCEHAAKDELLCFVFTMSGICTRIAREVHQLKRRDPSIEKRLSVIFTVASAKDTPHDGVSLFQHFVRGDQEANKLLEFCKFRRLNRTLSVADILFLSMESPYSTQTVSELLCQLVQSDKFRAQDISLSSDGALLDGWTTDDIAQWNRGSGPESIAVSVTYDRALLGSISALINADFNGYLLATTTLSVPDWQEYLKKKEGRLAKRKFPISYTFVEGFDPTHGTAQVFAGRLAPWTFERVLRQPMFYSAVTREDFSEVEREVYEQLLPNYISAFCFDSLRLFAEMQQSGVSTLRDLKLSDPHRHTVFKAQCPFEQIEFFIDGRTRVPVSVKELPLPTMQSSAGDATRKQDAVIVVDVQRDFCEGGSLSVPNTDSLLQRLIPFIEAARGKNNLIVFTQDWHPENHRSFEPFGGEWAIHCVAESRGAELMPPLKAQSHDRISKKGIGRDDPGYSAFANTDLQHRLQKSGVESVAICGIATEHCVRATALDAIEAGFRTTVLTDLIRGVQPELEAGILIELRGAGIHLIESKKWLTSLQLNVPRGSETTAPQTTND